LRKAIADQDIALGQIGLIQFRSALAGRIKLLAYRYGLAEQNPRGRRIWSSPGLARGCAFGQATQGRPSGHVRLGILEGNLQDLAVTQHDLPWKRSPLFPSSTSSGDGPRKRRSV